MEEVFDFLLAVRLFCRKLEMEGLHPAARNAYFQGALSGLKLGQTIILAGKDIDEEVVKLLTPDFEVNTSQIVAGINLVLGGPRVNFGDFYHSSYRMSVFCNNYDDGIKLGLEYTRRLFLAFSDSELEINAGRELIRHLEYLVNQSRTLTNL